MKILQINKTDAGGGSAVAANRINRALRRNGVESKMLVQDLRRSEEGVYSVQDGLFSKVQSKVKAFQEEFYLIPHQRNSAARHNFSVANKGVDIVNHSLVKEADVIHIHSVVGGFLSLKSLESLLSCGKPIVWTQHDMWSFTGGCHFSGSCLEFLEGCSYCPFLRKPGKSDLAARLFANKKKMYDSSYLSVVSSSKWLCTLAQESKLLRRKKRFCIPNPIDTNFYKPSDKAEARRKLGLVQNKKYLLFGADNACDPRKGMRYFIEALGILGENFAYIQESVELIVFGKISNQVLKQLPFKVNYFEYVDSPSKLVDLYNAADCYVLPSLQVNLPNTIMESMACGTPVVGFSIGGVPEMISHQKSGYLAEMKNSLSLATGIYEMLFVADLDTLSSHARSKAVASYSEDVVAQQYIQMYKSLMMRNR